MSDSDQATEFSHLISPNSISIYAGSVGHNRISEKALLTLSYDVTYKLYEILKECKTEMNVYRQSTLSTTIINNVFQNFGIPNLYGNKILIPYVSVPNTDMSVLHMTKIDLLKEGACDIINVEPEPIPFIKGIFIPPLSNTCGIANLMKSLNTIHENIKTEPKSELEDDNSSDYFHNKTSNLKENENMDISQLINSSSIQKINRTESDYFLVVAQIILNSSESLFNTVLEDLRTNPRLGNVYSSLLNLISNSVKYFENVGKLIEKLLRTLEALLDNQYIDSSASFSVDEAINALCTIILEPKTANDCDDFPFRRNASYLLMRALNTWNVSLEERKKILCTLKKTLISPGKISLKLNYSVLIMFYSLGYDVLDLHFWPILNKYLNVLSSFDEIISEKRSILLTNDICHVKSALLLLTGILYRNFWVIDPFIRQLHIISDILLNAYFGESLIPVREYAVSRCGPVFQTSRRNRTSKDNIMDIEKDYRNIQLYSFKKKSYSSDFSLNYKTNQHNITINDVFELPFFQRKSHIIIFNFIGSNQINYNHLKTKKLDSRYNIPWRGQQTKPFLKYEKTTRCIKYCKTKKILSGDIYLFI